MEKMIWSDKLNTGVQVIDRQHQRILDYLNRLQDALGNAASGGEIRNRFDDLVDYTLTHFVFEETMLAQGNHRSLSAHKQTHDVFSDKVRMLRTRFENPGVPTLDLSSQLETWLSDHIQMEDMRDVSAVLKNPGYAIRY